MGILIISISSAKIVQIERNAKEITIYLVFPRCSLSSSHSLKDSVNQVKCKIKPD